jgi:hypothetical protein
MRFDLSGRASLEVLGDASVETLFRRQLAPVTPSRAGTAMASVSVVPLDAGTPTSELQGPAEDGLTTGRAGDDDDEGFVTWDGRRCTIPNLLEGGSTFRYEAGFPLWRLVRMAIRPALQIEPAVSGRAAALHAASVTLDGGAIVVAGWAESGKTEVALALMERGASFLSDKWTFVGRQDLEASMFPISVGVRRWVLEYLPTLRGAATNRSKAQFAAARAAGLVLGPLGRRRSRTRAGALIPGMARQVAALGDRASFEIDELRAAYGQHDDPLRRARIRLLVLLITTPNDTVRLRALEPAELATRLARTAAYERRGYLNLLQRLAYFDPTAAASPTDAAIQADTGVLGDVCRGVDVVAVEAPFPADPGRVADAILARA